MVGFFRPKNKRSESSLASALPFINVFFSALTFSKHKGLQSAAVNDELQELRLL